MFLPLDLYNDAVSKTLYNLKSRYIYNEIEAEVNLCFDQFMFKLGRNVFKHCKMLCALQQLDSETSKPVWNPNGISKLGYDWILRQKDLKLLGRSIDISRILSQTMNQYLRRSISSAISRFESADFTGILVSLI
jgi:cytoplasmic FMR1 interacting protein